MIERTNFGYNVICDGKRCQEYLEVDSPDHQWSDVTSMMKNESWVSIKDRRGDWEHYCPLCKGSR